jgi:hypothetical protein
VTDQELKDLVASLAEDRKRSLEEFERSLEEFERSVERSFERSHEKSREEFDRRMEKLSEKVDRVCGKMGGIDENLGHHAEQFFQDVFDRKREFGGIKYPEVIPNFGRNDDVGKIEIDVAMFNGSSVALIEVKNRIHPDFVTEFTQERVKKFRTLYPKYDNYDIYLGIAGFSFDKTVLEEAKENGIGIVKQAGDSVEIEAENLKAY